MGPLGECSVHAMDTTFFLSIVEFYSIAYMYAILNTFAHRILITFYDLQWDVSVCFFLSFLISGTILRLLKPA